MLVHKIRRAMEITDGFSLAASVPHRPKDSGPPLSGRSSEGKLMIAGAVEVFESNTPGRVNLRKIGDQSGTTLKAFIGSATVRGGRVVIGGRAGCSGIENHKPVAGGDRPAHEVLDWQLVEWSFRWNWRRRSGDSFLALLDAGLGSGPATWKDITATEA